MKHLATQITAIATAISIICTPVIAHANTRAADAPSYASGNSDDDGAGLLPIDDSSLGDGHNWLIALFSAAATIGAIAIILSHQGGDSQRSPSSANQSNGAT